VQHEFGLRDSIALMVSTPTLAGQSKADQERQEIRKAAREVLARLHAAPGSRNDSPCENTAGSDGILK
jgi:hypothetical protein